MEYKQAKISDIEGVLLLHKKYQIDTISEEDKKDGFVTTPFTVEQLTKLIQEENGLFIAQDNENIAAYVMAASWAFWSGWPIFKWMISNLGSLEFMRKKINIQNSYQYGPVCIDKKYRGSGVLEEIFEFSRKEMSKRFEILITFINKINPRSFHAHTKKLGLTVIHEFEFNNNKYYELAYDTSKSLNYNRN